MTRDQAKIAIQKLIERFAEHRKAYHAADYNEAKTRQDFINPFFKALGWDVDNENGMSEAYREVIYEDKVVVRGKAKAPDYGFRLMGQGKKRLFYVEAKKPSVALKANKDAAYQLRRYGSSAQAPISILTNFEDFFVYDCSKVPNLSDSASVSRLKHIHFEDYVKEFDFIYDTFSHEAVTKGRFDKFVQSDANKKGSQTLDKEFVQSLDTWRKYLATSIAINNKKINDEELNFCVQLIIDRLIFLRFCEDRSVEPYGQLQSAASKGNAYNNLFELFEQADAKYNSGLFDFEKDKLTATLKIDNKVVKNIVEDLYFPQCRYEFSVMPVEVLGNAYEQFLGKVIRILPSRGVKIEEKPEVRKAGGVFYTPQYIVDYIVKNTVGKLIDGKAPKEIDKIKIVDPACGSGSFLVGAFEYLLNYHSDWYYHNLSEKEKKKGDIITPDGKLTTHEKKRILINNIYGVDIDANAVEVSKLSLLLKCMEGETEASIKQQVTMFHERVLPDLDNNLRDGNSLIDVDFYDEQIELGFERKIKPFSWKKNFPEVFKQGGFDVVIGNPPYVLGRETFDDSIKKYISTKYKSYGGKYDLYVFFCERALTLLKENGKFSFIIPNTILVNENATNIRQIILTEYTLETIRVFNYRVFEAAQVETVILVVNNKKSDNSSVINIEGDTITKINKGKFLSNRTYKFNVASDDLTEGLLENLESKSIKFGDITDICIGIQLGGSHGKSTKQDFLSEKSKDKTWKPVLDGKDINTYKLKWRKIYVRYGDWLHRKRDERYFLNPKILIRQIGKVPVATYDEGKYYTLNTLYNVISTSDYSLKFLLAVINSKIGVWFWLKRNSDFKTLFPKIKKSEIECVPVFKIDRTNSTHRKSYEEIIHKVTLILDLYNELEESRLQSKTDLIKQQIERAQENIDQLFYSLYKLTPEEIKIVEGGSDE